MLAGDTNAQCWFCSSAAALGADSGISSVGKIGSRSAMNSAWLGDGRTSWKGMVCPIKLEGLWMPQAGP